MENAGRVVSKAEVTENLVRNIANDQEEFRNSISILTHGQKNRLLESMISYPLIDSEFDSSEPELRVASTIHKRILDGLVALGTEAAIEGILASFANNQQNNEANGLTEGVTNVETTEGVTNVETTEG